MTATAEALATSSAPSSGTNRVAFPRLNASGPQVNASQHQASGTGLWLTLGYGMVAVLTLFSFGMFLGLLAFGWLVEMIQRKRLMARVKGDFVHLGPNQLPELYECVKTYAQRLGMREVPEVFMVESSTLNAFAFRIGARQTVTFTDDIIWGALQAGKPEALQFVIAHELAHHALGHVGLLRFTMKHTMFPLARLDELSADAVALQLVGQRELAYEGLMMLAVGPQMLSYINRDGLLQQAMEVGENKQSKKAERGLTHPLLFRRLYTLRNVQLAR